MYMMITQQATHVMQVGWEARKKWDGRQVRNGMGSKYEVMGGKLVTLVVW